MHIKPHVIRYVVFTNEDMVVSVCVQVINHIKPQTHVLHLEYMLIY